MRQQLRKTLLLIIILVLWLIPAGVIRAAEESAAEPSTTAPAFSIEDTMKSLDIQALEEYKKSIDGELNPDLDKKSVKEWLTDFASGKWEFDIKKTLQNLVQFLFKEVLANSNLLGKIIILSVLAALLVNLQTAFSGEVSKISYLACFLALCAIAIGSFKVVLGIGQQTIDNMVSFMMGMLPQMLVLVAGLGNVNASVMIFPIMMTTATAFANAIKTIVFPLIIMSALLNLVNHMSDTIKVQRLAGFFRQMAQLSLSLLLTIFVGIITLRTVYASALDKVTLRTTKFITDNAIPVVGKMFSDTIEVAAGYVVMLKQAMGILGVIIIFGIIIFPLLKIAALALIYKISAAVVEPMGDSKTAAVLETMSTHLFLMLAAIASVGLMFFIMLAIIAATSNSMVMLR